jgi:hypothetical protein
MTLLFAAQLVLFRQRWLLGLAILSFLVAAYGVAGFVEQVLGWSISPDLSFYCLAVAVMALLFPGRLIDRWTERFVIGKDLSVANTPWNWCAYASRWVTLLVSSAWISRSLSEGGAIAFGPCDIVLTALLALQALVAASPVLGGVTICFAGGLALIDAVLLKTPLPVMASTAAGGMLVLWLISYALERRPTWRVSKAFGSASRGLSLFGLTPLALGYLVQSGMCLVMPVSNPDWLSSLLVLAWTFDAARRTHRGQFALLGVLFVFGWIGAVWTHLIAPGVSREWLVSVWSVTALLAVPIAAALRGRCNRLESQAKLAGLDDPRIDGCRAVAWPIERLVVSCLTLLATLSLLWFALPMHVAGGIAVAGLAGQGALSRQSRVRQMAYILGNWQALGLVLTCLLPELRTWLELTPALFSTVAIPIAAGAAVSVLLFRRLYGVSSERAEFSHAHRQLLHLVTAAGLSWSMLSPLNELPAVHLMLAAAAFGLTTLELLAYGCRRQNANPIWLAELVIVAGFLFYWKFGVIHLGQGLAMYGVMIAGLAFWIAGRLANRDQRTAVMAEPFLQTALGLPLLTVAIGIGRHFLASDPVWLGANSLALLLAAGFYFWRGLEGGKRRWIVLSTVILNVALALLWNELAWNDPQFFMIPLGLSLLAIVQFLKREVPKRWLDPLRYAGALTILVSPTFHIVEGSWLHLMTLMVAAVCVTLLSIGLHVRALMYTGTAFLVADLLAMVIRGGIDRPNILWIAGIALGSAVILLGALCENHREAVLQRLQMLAAELETWQ